METLSPNLLHALKVICAVFDENDEETSNFTVGAVLSMLCEDVFEIVDILSFQYAVQKMILTKIVPIAHLIHEACFLTRLNVTAPCPITLEDRSQGLYLGGSKHCITLKDALQFFFKNGIRRLDGGEIIEIRRVGAFECPDFLEICRPIALLKILKEIDENIVLAEQVVDYKNACIEDVNDGFEEIIDEVDDFQAEYNIKGTFLGSLKHLTEISEFEF
jgi:hypothetical protein